MILRAYSIYDNKALIYNPPYFAGTDGAALRSFQEVANDMNTSIGRHPGDYSLWYVGDFDDLHGVLIPVRAAHVADAVSLIQVQPPLGFDQRANQANGKEAV